MDRRGHFRAVGETTTADLVNYKERQREAKQEELVTEADKAEKAEQVAKQQKEVRCGSVLRAMTIRHGSKLRSSALCKFAMYLGSVAHEHGHHGAP